MLLRRPRQRMLEELLGLLERGVVSSGDLDEMLERLCALFDGAAIALAQTPDFVGPGRGLRIPAEWPEIHARYRHQDPVPKFLGPRANGSTFSVAGDLEPAMREWELYAEFRRLGFGDGIVTRIYSPFSDELFLVIYREHGARAVSAQDRMLVRLLHPHLAGALAAKCALSHLHSRSGAPDVSAAAAISGSVALSYPTMRVEWSRRARALWRRRLGAIRDLGWKRIERMIVRAAQRFDRWEIGGRSQILVPGIRVELANVPPHAGEQRRVIAMFLEDRERGDERDAPSAPAEELLSFRQRQVAREAAGGKTTAQIAERLGMSAETARWHLKLVFERLGISHRADLARLITPSDGGG